CAAGPAGPPTPPSDPTMTGYEPPGGSTDVTPGAGGTIQQLCAYDCMRFQTICPGGAGDGTNCVPSCAEAAASIPGCESQFRAYLACLASAPATCTNGTLELTGCDGAIIAINN